MKAVAIVLDHDFGDRLGPLSERYPVWAVGSATNRQVAGEIWRTRPSVSLTTFQYSPEDPVTRTLAEILPTVDEHHGQYSAPEPWTHLIVLGARANTATRDAVAGIGFTIIEETVDGFIAVRSAAG